VERSDTSRQEGGLDDGAKPVPRSFGFGDDDAWLRRVRSIESAEPLGQIGAYEILGEAGRGAQGVVYRARRSGTRLEVALKRLVAGSLATPEMRRRFDREIEAASTLNHPNIVRILGIDDVDGQRVLTMEWVDGVPITEWATAKGPAGRSLNELMQVFMKTCEAVQHAHQRGVIHRDLKPSNLLVDDGGEPRVVDFGLAKSLDIEASEDRTVTRTGQFVGTPAYASPEQLQGVDPFDVRSDVYSLGVILYHLIAGELPYRVSGSLVEMAQAIQETEPVSPSSLSGRGDRMLDAIVLKAIAREKRARYQSVEALADDIRRYLHGDAVMARPMRHVDRFVRLVRRNPVAASFMMAVFVGLIVGFVHLSRLSGSLMEQTALESAAMHSDMLDRLNTLYSDAVAWPMQGLGITVTHDMAGRTDAIPLPATFTIALGEDMEDSKYGMKLRLYSEFPYRTRTNGGPHDNFERDALRQLRRQPDDPVYRFEDYNGRYSLRYATARRMDRSCVGCHNHHPDSPKRDWQVGDVRGVLEIIHPLARDVERTGEALRGTFVLAGSISGALFLLSIIAMFAGNRRRVQRFAGGRQGR